MFSSPNLALTCALWVLVTSVSCLQPTDKETRYRKCKKGDGIFTGNVVATLINKPRMRCYEACSLDDRCRSLNVCPSERPAGYHCDLMDDVHPLGCHDLTTDSHLDCVYQVKVSKCGEGGDLERSDGTCQCKVCYKGALCQDHVRDCQEARDALAPSSSFEFNSDNNKNKQCVIRPTSASRPFLVKCAFGPSNATRVFWRSQEPATGYSGVAWSQQKWVDFKKGLGRSGTGYNYFVGLENLHHFLAQATYRLNLWNAFSYSDPELTPCTSTTSYLNLIIGQETQNYSLSYDLYTNSSNASPKETEFFSGANVSHVFCTPDKDCGSCAQDNGPGWYPTPGVTSGGAACGGMKAFFGKPAYWPSGCPDHGMLPLQDSIANLERVGDFY